MYTNVIAVLKKIDSHLFLLVSWLVFCHFSYTCGADLFQVLGGQTFGFKCSTLKTENLSPSTIGRNVLTLGQQGKEI